MFKSIPAAIPEKIASTLLTMPPPVLLGRKGKTAVYTKKGTGRKKIKYKIEMVFARQPDFKKNITVVILMLLIRFLHGHLLSPETK